MIRLLYPERWLGFDIVKNPEGRSNKGLGGGMAVKTARVLEALSQRFLTHTGTLGSVRSGELLVVDPLWFTLDIKGKGETPEERAADQQKKLDARAESLLKRDNPIILYCSEMELMRWGQAFRKRVLDRVDVLTCNCEFQRSVFSYYGVHTKYILTDPIPEEVFHIDLRRGKDPRPRVVSSGQIAPYKNSAGMADVLEIVAEKVKDAEFCYLGSASLWGQNSSRESLRLEKRFKALCGDNLKTVRSAEVASELALAKAFYIDTYHDCFSLGMAEAMMCGAPVVSGPHGLSRERHCKRGESAKEQAHLLIETLNMSGKSWWELAEDTAAAAAANYSYAAFMRQFEEVLECLR